jgi:DNA repair protein RadC
VIYGESEIPALIARVANMSESRAKRLAALYPAGLASANAEELVAAGCTPVQAERLVAAFRLAACSLPRAQDRPAMRTPALVVDYLRREFGHAEQECFAVVLLDARQSVISTRVVGMGSIAQVDVHPREVFKYAVRCSAHSLIVAHNHPSGDPAPSEADLALTDRLVKAGATMGIPVLDHLIVTTLEFCSLAALGAMGGK